MTIETDQEFCCEKLISLRKKGTLSEIKTAAKQLGNYLKSNSINKTGPTITAIFSAENAGGKTVLDTEILIPVDRLFAPECGYIFKSKFRLINAARLTITTKPERLRESFAEFIRYVKAHNFRSTAMIYRVMKEEPFNNGSEDMTLDLYIGDVHPGKIYSLQSKHTFGRLSGSESNE
jgi:effector-binding domain-containing protein